MPGRTLQPGPPERPKGLAARAKGLAARANDKSFSAVISSSVRVARNRQTGQKSAVSPTDRMQSWRGHQTCYRYGPATRKASCQPRTELVSATTEPRWSPSVNVWLPEALSQLRPVVDAEVLQPGPPTPGHLDSDSAPTAGRNRLQAKAQSSSRIRRQDHVILTGPYSGGITRSWPRSGILSRSFTRYAAKFAKGRKLP